MMDNTPEAARSLRWHCDKDKAFEASLGDLLGVAKVGPLRVCCHKGPVLQHKQKQFE
jgi:hypothetical protein